MSKPQTFLGRDRSAEALDAAAIQLWVAIYRDKHGTEPEPALVEEVRRVLRENPSPSAT